MKTLCITILMFSVGAAGCSTMLEFKDYNVNCGNAQPDPGEECDEGPGNSDTAPDACRRNCRNPHCGDGVVDTGEFCDEGALNGQIDHCSLACDGIVIPGICGDGMPNPGEACDDGVNDGTYGGCMPDCQALAPGCGDEIIQPAYEQCDGANMPSTTCEELGQPPGPLSCTPSCEFDISQCVDPPICVVAEAVTCGFGFTGSTDDQGSRDGLIGHCTSAGVNHTGREIVYRFSNATARWVSVNLGGFAQDLDLFVIQEFGPDCMDYQCEAVSQLAGNNSEALSFFAEAGVGYYIVVDGFHDAAESFDLDFNCYPQEDCIASVDLNHNGLYGCEDPDCVGWSTCLSSEINCSDGLDNDEDLDIDCADSDCDGTDACTCHTNATMVGCGDTLSSDNYSSGSQNLITGGYCGNAPAIHTGPERVFQLSPPATAPSMVTFRITGLTADMDLYAIRATGGYICDVTNCANGPVNQSAQAGLVDEEVTVNYPVSDPLYFVVDGWAYAKGEFNVQVICNN